MKTLYTKKKEKHAETHLFSSAVFVSAVLMSCREEGGSCDSLEMLKYDLS